MEYVLDYLWKGIVQGLKNVEWAILEMDVTQWGVVSAIIVVTGFIALRSRL